MLYLLEGDRRGHRWDQDPSKNQDLTTRIKDIGLIKVVSMMMIKIILSVAGVLILGIKLLELWVRVRTCRAQQSTEHLQWSFPGVCQNDCQHGKEDTGRQQGMWINQLTEEHQRWFYFLLLRDNYFVNVFHVYMTQLCPSKYRHKFVSLSLFCLSLSVLWLSVNLHLYKFYENYFMLNLK